MLFLSHCPSSLWLRVNSVAKELRKQNNTNFRRIINIPICILNTFLPIMDTNDTNYTNSP